MSTEANAALAWPIEITEFARTGDQLVDRKKTPAAIRELWNRDEDQAPPALELCGTDIPGNVRFTYEPEIAGLFYSHRDRPEAAMFWSEGAMVWLVRSFLGDWRTDPTITEEGCETGFYWAITAEGTKLLPTGTYSEFERNVDLMHSLGSGPAFGPLEPVQLAKNITVSHAQVCGVEQGTGRAVCVCDHPGLEPVDPDENCPDDYEGYVDYVCLRSPGLDGRTYYDGTTKGDTDE